MNPLSQQPLGGFILLCLLLCLPQITVSALSVSSVNPDPACPGTLVTISGNQFNPSNNEYLHVRLVGSNDSLVKVDSAGYFIDVLLPESISGGIVQLEVSKRELGTGVIVESSISPPFMVFDIYVAYPVDTFCTHPDTSILPALGVGGYIFSTLWPSPPNVGIFDGELSLDDNNHGYNYVIWQSQACPNIADTMELTVHHAWWSSNNYYPQLICQNGAPTVQPISVSPQGGEFKTDTNRLVLNSISGEIDVALSDTGWHEVVYIPPYGHCQQPDTVHFRIVAGDDPSVLYPQQSYCANEPDPTPLVATPGGVFSAPSNSGIVFGNPSTGTIDLLASHIHPNSNYVLTYQTPGACPEVTAITLQIQFAEADFSIRNSICKSEGGVEIAYGMQGVGFFTASDTSLTFANTANPSGASSLPLIDISNTPAGTYVITHQLDPLATGCVDSYNDTLTILPEGVIPFTYPNPVGCSNGSAVISAPAFQGQIWSPDSLTYIATTGQIFPSVTPPGSYDLYYIYNDPFCPDTLLFPYQILVLPPGQGDLVYPSTVFCENDSNPLPFSYSPLGGAFSSLAGGVVDQATGSIDLSASPANTPFSIVYTPSANTCQDPDTFQVTVTQFAATFDYCSDTICKLDTSRLPCFQNQTGPLQGFGPVGSFGLALDPVSGAIDLAQTSTGGHLTYAIFQDSICVDTFWASDSVHIVDPPDAAFSLPDSICLNGADPTAQSIQQGGNFLSLSAGCVVDFTTGQVFLDSSQQGLHTIIHYIDNGHCVVSDSQDIYLLAPRVSGFQYPQDTLCTNGLSVAPNLDSGFAQGGIFTYTPLDPNSVLYIDNGTGLVNPVLSSPGTFLIEYTAPPPCPTTSTFTIEILSGSDPFFAYFDTLFCSTDTHALVDVSTLNAAGGYFQAPAGLEVDSLTGTLNILASTPNTYTVTFNPAGPTLCPPQQEARITIVPYDSNTTFTYQPDTFCTKDGIVNPIVIGDSSGLFSLSNGTGLNPTNGALNLDLVSLGDLLVTYQLGGVCAELVEQELYVRDLDDADFGYESVAWCPNVSNPAPDLIALPGGSFSSNEIVVNSTTGEVELWASQDTDGYIFYTTNGPCPSRDSFRLRIHANIPPLAWSVYPDTSICLGDSVSFTTNSAPWVNFMVNGSLVSSSYVFDSKDFQEGDVVEMIHSTDAICWDTVRLSMDVNLFPILAVEDKTLTTSGGVTPDFLLESSHPITQIHWEALAGSGVVVEPAEGTLETDPSNYSALLSLNASTVHPNYPGAMEVVVQPVAEGCVGETDTLRIMINPEGVDVFVPELITPNGDGFNDRWIIQWATGIDPQNYSMQVFNRSFGLVKEFTPLHDQWDGGTLPDGVYKWILRDLQGGPMRSGALTIRRK